MRLTVRQKLKARLVALGIMAETSTIHRIQRGHWGKSAGQWVWCVRDSEGIVTNVGSADTMKECLDADRLDWTDSCYHGDREVVAENDR